MSSEEHKVPAVPGKHGVDSENRVKGGVSPRLRDSQSSYRGYHSRR